MKASLNEIKKYVDLEGLTSKEIANRLTFAGVEVEEVKTLAYATNLVIGRIIKCDMHPDSDHLHVLMVDEGELGIHQIVCGAPNAREGINVIVAIEWCKLNGGTITKSVIRGVESDGMCCSLVELGLDPKYLEEKETKGIHELPSDAPIGNREVLKYLGLDDEILDLKVLANRPDLLSIYNIAREIGGLFSRRVNIPSYQFIDKKSEYIASSKTDKCSTFAISVINNCKNYESPMWLKTALTNNGIRSISALVDIGNYVMLLTGQPINMYDASALSKKELYATTDFEGKWLALDEKEYDLVKGDIVIESNNEPLCLGGLMTSSKASVTYLTKDVVVEVATFDDTTIRHTSSRVGLASESSTRFVKGINHFQVKEVLAFAISLINELCGGSYEGSSIYTNEEYKEQILPLSYEKINARLATSFTKDEIDKALYAFGFSIRDGNVVVPQYRLDITSTADLSEEIIRYYGTESINVRLPKVDVIVGKWNPQAKKEKYLYESLVAFGMSQCLNYTLVNKDKIDRYLYLNEGAKALKIMNPLTDDHEYMRLSLIPSLLENCVYNYSRKQNDISIFEISHIYSDKGPTSRLGVVCCGGYYVHAHLTYVPYNFYQFKGSVVSILDTFGIDQNRYKIERLVSDKNEFHPYRSCVIKFGNKVVGVFGELHPLEKDRLGIDRKMPLYAFELNLQEIFALKTSKLKMQQISKFPPVSRDLAFICKKDVTYGDLVSEIRKCGKGIIKDVEIFDIYEGVGIPDGYKSMAFNITYELMDRTLTDADINEVEGKIIQALLNKFNATLRA